MPTDSAKTLAQLLPIEALAWINRWAKLPNRFYYHDLDKLYQIKDCKIAELTRTGLMQATCIVQRETPAIAGMRQQLANDGAQLSHLDLHGHS